jgi:N-sulfoglucosamine sulfohydrolase
LIDKDTNQARAIMIKKLITTLLLLPLSHFVCAASIGKPNILFAMADDWGWPHAGAYGDTSVRTPTFDRIAREGFLFNHAYVTSPSCTPSRNSVITGRYFWELGSGANLWSTLPAEHESFIHLLADNGYIIGRDTPKTWGPGNIDSWKQHHGAHPSGTQYSNFGAFLDQTEAKEKPFFFWLATSDPHRGYDRDSGIRSGIDPAKVHLFAHFPDSDIVRRDIADYYFEVQRWDSKVGYAISLLEKRDLLENTIIIMTGDNGMPFPRGKGNLYDSGVRVPFAVRWGNKVKPGRYVNDFISFADIAPTLLELTGTPIPNVMTGLSFAGLLIADQSGNLDPNNRSNIVFGRERHNLAQQEPYQVGYPSRGLRTGEFLYIRNYRPERWPSGVKRKNDKIANPAGWYSDCDPSPTKLYIIDNRDKDHAHRRAFKLSFAKRPSQELYDLEKDPGQINNLAKKPKYRQILNKMSSQLQERLSELNDPRAIDPDYDGFDKHPYLRESGMKKI